MFCLLNRINFRKAIGALLLLGACTCDKPAAPPLPSPKLPAHWLARVNGEVLVLGDLERELAIGFGSAEGEVAKPPISPEVLLEALIHKTLLLQEAKRQQLFPNEAQVKQHIQVLMSGSLGDRVQHQVDTANFEKITAEQMAIEALLSEEVFARIAITEKELHGFYESNAELFFAPAEIEASQILVKTQQEANKLLRLLRAGHPFGKLARQYSIAPEAENGGKLGRFGKNVMPSPLDEALFAMRANEVSNAIPSPFGWHLFWVHQKFRPQRTPFVKVRKLIEAKLVSEYGTQMKADFLRKLKSQSHIEINPTLLAATWPDKRASEETP